jgi:hypothetical protein
MSRAAVWKFVLDLNAGREAVDMPSGATVLDVQMQHDQLTMWAEVDPDGPLRARMFVWYGTGHPMPPAFRKFLGTVQLEHGHFVLHVFEELPAAVTQ